MMELSPSSSFCPGTFPPTTNFFLFNHTIPPVHINNLNNQTKPPVHINNLRVNQGCPVPAKRVGLIKKKIQNKQPHLGAKQGIAPADYTISNQNIHDPRQDLTATQPRVNSSGFGLSSPALQQPSTKPFSGLPARQLMTSPYREAGEAVKERPGIVYPLLPRATRPDRRLTIDAASLPESAALGRQSRPPTVLELGETALKENRPPSQFRRQPRKRRCNRLAGVYRPSKRSPPRGRWCD